MARHVEEDLAAVYQAVIQVTGSSGNPITWRYGAYNTRGVAQGQVNRILKRLPSHPEKEGWVEKAETTWTRV